MLTQTITYPKPYLRRLIKDATATAKLWDEAFKREFGWEEAVAGLYKTGYTITELVSGLRMSRDKTRRAIARSGIPTRLSRNHHNISAREWEELQALYNYKCAYCGKKTRLSKDHIMPVSKGGENSIENIVPACRRCNSQKHTRALSEWPQFRKLQLNLLVR